MTAAKVMFLLYRRLNKGHYLFIVGHLQPSHVWRTLVNRAEQPTVIPHVSVSTESQVEPQIEVGSLAMSCTPVKRTCTALPAD